MRKNITIAVEDVEDLANLMTEEKEILDWMNETQHPSEFPHYVQLENLSKRWTEKENRLREVKSAIKEITG